MEKLDGLYLLKGGGKKGSVNTTCRFRGGETGLKKGERTF